MQAERTDMNTIDKFNSHIMGSYGRLNVVLDKGEDDKAVDGNGKTYIDFGSGIGTNSLGYCNKEWADAVCEQVRSIQHTSNYYYTKVQAEFAERLSEAAGMKNMFLCNSGAGEERANECAIKIARKYSFDKYGKGRHNIITLVNSFHGIMLCTLSATGQDVFHNYFFPFVDGFINVEANNIEDLKAKLDDTVCAVMFEYIQGEGGVVPLEQKFVDAIFELCAERDVLTISDEVQTGVGRTGKFLAGDNFGKKADIITLAKGIAGGIPMGACLSGDKCAGVAVLREHTGHTSAEILSLVQVQLRCSKKAADPIFLSQVADKGRYIAEKLKENTRGRIGYGYGSYDWHKAKDKECKGYTECRS